MSIEGELRAGLIDEWEAMEAMFGKPTPPPPRPERLHYTVQPASPWRINHCMICRSEHLGLTYNGTILCTDYCFNKQMDKEKYESARYDDYDD